MKKYFLVASMALCLACTAKAQKLETYQSTQARVLEPQSNAYVHPLTVELKIIENGQRVRDSWHLTPENVNAFRGNVQDIRSWGIYMSCQKHDCDVIVAATFNLKSDDTSNGYELEVVGYPAIYQNWKTATQTDYEWIRSEKTFTTDEREKVSAVIKR